MRFTGEFMVPADRAVVFARLRDHELLAGCVDGVREVEPIDERNYRAILETRLAYIRFRFAIEVELTELDAPASMKVRAVGQPLGMVGRLAGDAALQLVDSDGGTLVSYELDLAVAGKLGSIGQPVFRAKAKEMEKAFVAKFNASFECEVADARI